MTKSFFREAWAFILAGVLFLGALTGGCIWYASEFGVEVQSVPSSTTLTDAQLREVPLAELEIMYANAGSSVVVDPFGIPVIDHNEMSRIGSAMSDVRKMESSGAGG